MPKIILVIRQQCRHITCMSNTAFQTISTATRNKIAAEVGNFVFISFSTFEAHGINRTRYTVRKPRGSKMIHLIGFEDGTIQAI